MTQEDKNILLKDISARLPYKVKCSIIKKGVIRELKPMNNGISMPVNQVCDITLIKALNTDIINDFVNDNIVLKPYLRPMSSMTEEEYYGEYQRKVLIMRDADETLHWLETVDSIDWLNTHHFDYRGLIEKGLALEAPERMYKTK